VLVASVYTGTTDGPLFTEWIEHELLPLCNPFPGVRSVVVMDNASIHHNQAITDLFTTAGVVLVYLPPYSPDFNPIEEFFAQLKALIKRHFHVWEDGVFEGFEEFLAWCIQRAGSDKEAAKGHFRNCYIDC